MFLRVTDTRYGDRILININNISHIAVDGRCLFMNGITGDGDGIVWVSQSDLEKILEKIDMK